MPIRALGCRKTETHTRAHTHSRSCNKWRPDCVWCWWWWCKRPGMLVSMADKLCWINVVCLCVCLCVCRVQMLSTCHELLNSTLLAANHKQECRAEPMCFYGSLSSSVIVHGTRRQITRFRKGLIWIWFVLFLHTEFQEGGTGRDISPEELTDQCWEAPFLKLHPGGKFLLIILWFSKTKWAEHRSGVSRGRASICPLHVMPRFGC